jgi:4-amino-4-deoxy-L-arabinose transferase-like glycosyltransferase
LGTAIVATQILTIMSAVRSIPDILLGLFVTFSALGFAGIIKHGNTTPKKYLWYLYLGLALGIEAKGAPALVLGIVGLLYLLFNPWKPIKVKTLFHYPSLIVSVVIASFWFVLMYLQHGFLFIDSFYNDQVGIRVSMQIWSVVKNMLLSIALLFILHLPWSTMLRKIGFLQFKKTNAETKSFVGFAILWLLVIVLGYYIDCYKPICQCYCITFLHFVKFIDMEYFNVIRDHNTHHYTFHLV